MRILIGLSIAVLGGVVTGVTFLAFLRLQMRVRRWEQHRADGQRRTGTATKEGGRP